MDSQKQGCFNVASFGHDECAHRVGEDISALGAMQGWSRVGKSFISH